MTLRTHSQITLLLTLIEILQSMFVLCLALTLKWLTKQQLNQLKENLTGWVNHSLVKFQALRQPKLVKYMEFFSLSLADRLIGQITEKVQKKPILDGLFVRKKRHSKTCSALNLFMLERKSKRIT